VLKAAQRTIVVWKQVLIGLCGTNKAPVGQQFYSFIQDKSIIMLSLHLM